MNAISGTVLYTKRCGNRIQACRVQVGYRVFLGNGKYFVSSDVGGGKMQWYGFHKEPAGDFTVLFRCPSRTVCLLATAFQSFVCNAIVCCS